MKKLLLALLLFATPAAAQNPPVHQSGTVTPKHVPMWTTNGVIQDGGTAVKGFLSGLGVTAIGPGICQNSGPTTSPYNQICLSTSNSGPAQLQVNNFGGPPLGLQFVVNGVTYPFPFSGGGGGGALVVGTTPVTGGIVGDCLTTAGGNLLGQTTCSGGGGGGLSITHAQITTTDTASATSLVLTGYSTPNDLGSGAPYTCSGQTSSSIGAIQDITGTWCAFDLGRVSEMDGFQPGWFGATDDNVSDSTAGVQAAIDAGFNSGLNNVFCQGTTHPYRTSYPIFDDPPGNLRGGQAYVAPYFSNTAYLPNSVVKFNGVFYSDNTSLVAFGAPPSSPNFSGVGQDLGYKIVNSTASVTYNPTFTNSTENDVVLASFKGSSIGTPVFIAGSGQNDQTGFQGDGSFITTTSTAPAGSTIVVSVGAVQSGTLGAGGVTDSAGHTYVQVAHLNENYIFAAVNIGTQLVSGGRITVSGDGYTAIAVSVTGLTASDVTATAHFANSASPTVSSGTLGQAVEIVFGSFVESTYLNFFRAAAGFTESTGFTTTTPSVWSLGTYNAGTTYSAGNVVYYPPANPIPWQSLTNGNLNNTPTDSLAPNGPVTPWQPISLTNRVTANGSVFHGAPLYAPGNNRGGCNIFPSFNNSVAFVMASGNGNVLKNVSVIGPNGGVRCGQPNTGAGIASMGGNGGANRTKYEDVTVQNFYYGMLFGGDGIQDLQFGGPGLGAENHLYNPDIFNTCNAYIVRGTQGFINTIFGGTITDNMTAINMPTTNGLDIQGGNYSHENGPFPNTKFAMTTPVVTDGGTLVSFTTTLTLGGDPYMVQACNETINVNNGQLPTWPQSSNPSASDVPCYNNVFNAFTLKTADYGVIPLRMTAFNPGTGAATFYILNSWVTAYGGNQTGSNLDTEIAAQSFVWASEMTRKFVGNMIMVDQVHIEDSAPFQLADTSAVFGGGPDPMVLKNIFFNASINFCFGLYTPGNAATEAPCFAAQEFPWINMGNGDLVLENTGPPIGDPDFVMVDFAQNIVPTSGGHLITRGWGMGQFNFRVPSNSVSTNNGNMSTYSNYGSVAFGQGEYENSPFLAWGQGNIGGNGVGEGAWTDRSQGISKSHFYGTRPDPSSTPCITPLQLAKAQNTSNALPTMYFDGSNWQVPYSLLWSGQQYKICDWNLTPTAYSGAVTYYPGALVTNAGTIYVNMAGDGGTLGNLNHTPGTPQTFTASIAGTTMTVTATSGSVLVRAPITGAGVAAQSTIVAQINGTPGSSGDYQVFPSQTVGSETITATYWASLGATFHYGAVSNHGGGYSYGQDITTAMLGGTWSITNNSPYMQSSSLVPLLFPGLVVGLVGTQGGCTQENFAIRGVHNTLKYLDLFNIDTDIGGFQIPNYGAGVCSNTLMKQAPYSLTNLN